MLFSSGDFSFLLTLSSLVSVFSFLMVALKIETTRSCKGVSLRMMECPLVLFSDDCSNTFDVLRCFLMTFPFLLAVVLCYFDVIRPGYLAIFCFRLFAIVPFEGYLPFDKSGDWFYQTCEALGFCLAGTMVCLGAAFLLRFCSLSVAFRGISAASGIPRAMTRAPTTSSTTGWRSGRSACASVNEKAPEAVLRSSSKLKIGPKRPGR